MRKRSFLTTTTVYQELGRELERHGESLAALIRLALDELLADFPRLRELYHEHERRAIPISRRKLRMMERELVDRVELYRAQRAARYLARFGGNICSTSVMTERRRELKAMREGKNHRVLQ